MLFSLVLLAIGVYVLVSGIAGKGKLFAVENLKEGYEEKYKKAMRIFFIPIGALMVVNGVASVGKSLLYEVAQSATGEITYTIKAGYEAFSALTPKLFDIVNYVCMGLVIVGVVGWMFVTRKMTDRTAARAAAANPAADRQAGHILPVSAFEFDEEPEADAAKPDEGENAQQS